MKLFELQIHFFRPLWRRILTVIVCFGWAGFEYVNGAPIWAAVFVALGAYAAYQFFYDNWP